MDQHTEGKWVIHGINCRKDNQLQTLELPVEYLSRECKLDIKASEGNMFNPKFKENVQGRKYPGNCAFAEQVLLCNRKLKRVVQKVQDGHENPSISHNYYD